MLTDTSVSILLDIITKQCLEQICDHFDELPGHDGKNSKYHRNSFLLFVSKNIKFHLYERLYSFLHKA